MDVSLHGHGSLATRRRAARGKLTLITGCMFSGKTTELLAAYGVAAEQQRMAFKHACDTRYGCNCIVTHDGASIRAWPVASARSIPTLTAPGTTFVAIDEAHFFDESLVDVIASLIDSRIDVAVTALDRDCRAASFPVISELCSMADRARRKTAHCALCGRTADRTQRYTPIINEQMVAGRESYEPRCARCWREPVVAKQEVSSRSRELRSIEGNLRDDRPA